MMMMPDATASLSRDGLLAALLAEESYRPSEPASLDETGLPTTLIETLVCKQLLLTGVSTGRRVAEQICLPFRILEEVFQSLRSRQIIQHKGSAPFNDYSYCLTEDGRNRAQSAMDACAYVGPAPIPLMDYILSTEAQTIRSESPKREQLRDAFANVSINETLFETLGPAINSGAGLFLYGEPGNGKSTLAKCITMCFGQRIWIPHALIEDGQIIKLYDAAVHQIDSSEDNSIIKSSSYDRRWIKIRRPTVVVGGELVLDNLEIRHDPHSNISEAPVQLRSNCGCLLIDDFGRQRIEPSALLNRWIVPLESRVDFLTLPTGKKIQVPFEQLIIFSTNLAPEDLVDEAFLRRIPYKIEIGNPTEDEFHRLFKIYAEVFSCDYRAEVVENLLQKHYRESGRPLRRCHPRDLLSQVRNYCAYNDLPLEMSDEYFDRVVQSYFTVVWK
jgi:predicted ATPase with chaperone activity